MAKLASLAAAPLWESPRRCPSGRKTAAHTRQQASTDTNGDNGGARLTGWRTLEPVADDKKQGDDRKRGRTPSPCLTVQTDRSPAWDVDSLAWECDTNYSARPRP